MELRPLGRTGVRVPVLCLGTMTFGNQCDEATSHAILDRALEAGIDFVDTADVYPMGRNVELAGRTEEILGLWMRERGVRERIFLASKCRGRVGPGANDQGLSRYHVMRAVEASLRRLRTDVIDLYQAHFLDLQTPTEETLRALDDLVRQGKVRYVGCSNFPAWRVAEALGQSERLGLARFQTLQPRYNLLYREIEGELLPLARSAGLGVIVYNPIAGGLLSGKYRRGEEAPPGSRGSMEAAGELFRRRYFEPVQLEIAEGLAKESERRGLALASVAVAWVLAQEGVTSAIVGASRPEQLDATLAGAGLALDPELARACEAAWWRIPRRPSGLGYT